MKRFKNLAKLGASLYVVFGLMHLVFYVYLTLSGAFEEQIFTQMKAAKIDMFGEHDYLAFYRGLNIMTGVYVVAIGAMGLMAMPWASATPSNARVFSSFYTILSMATLVLLVVYSHIPAMAFFVAVITIFVTALLSVTTKAQR